jgi:hypothetical protein
LRQLECWGLCWRTHRVESSMCCSCMYFQRGYTSSASGDPDDAPSPVVPRVVIPKTRPSQRFYSTTITTWFRVLCLDLHKDTATLPQQPSARLRVSYRIRAGGRIPRSIHTDRALSNHITCQRPAIGELSCCKVRLHRKISCVAQGNKSMSPVNPNGSPDASRSHQSALWPQ